MAFTPRRQRPLRMNPRSRRGRLARVPALAALLLLTTCTEDHNPFSPGKTWITPTGQVTADPPALLVGAGDIASCSSTGDDATAKLLDSISGTVFTIGDDAYENGSSSDYTKCYHPNWGRHKARTKPSAGNHEYQTSGATGYFNYYGAAGGEPGKGYYSYDVGHWHVSVLNSNISMSAGSTQEQWLKADLAANPRFCTLAYWHHPLYASTSGSGSGGVTESKVRPIWDDLYASGADLVLGGHRHMYERQAPQKPDRTADPLYGVREIVVGTGGESHISPTNVSKNSEVRNGDAIGVPVAHLAVLADVRGTDVTLPAGPDDDLTDSVQRVGGPVGFLRCLALIHVPVAAEHEVGTRGIQIVPYGPHLALRDAPRAASRCRGVQRVVPIGQCAEPRVRGEVGLEPLLLRGARGHRDVAVEHDDVPVPHVVAIVAFPRLTPGGPVVVEIPGRSRGLVFVVARRRLGARLVPADRKSTRL